MKKAVVRSLLSVVVLVLSAMSAGAEELTVKSILAAQQAGAPADGIIAMVNSSDNTIAMTAGDMVSLRHAEVPETVIEAILARIPSPPPEPVALLPDDARLVDVVRLIKSGVSESIIAEKVQQSGLVYDLSVNDLLYLKENGAREMTVSALMATRAKAAAPPVVAPDELVFDGLVLVKREFWKKNRMGNLVMRGDALSWIDSDDLEENFTFKNTGLEKVWFTCDVRSPENFCYQINFQIVNGDLYQFRDSRRESGSNTAVTRVMEALRTYFPRLAFGAPDN